MNLTWKAVPNSTWKYAVSHQEKRFFPKNKDGETIVVVQRTQTLHIQFPARVVTFTHYKSSKTVAVRNALGMQVGTKRQSQWRWKDSRDGESFNLRDMVNTLGKIVGSRKQAGAILKEVVMGQFQGAK